MGDKAKEKHLFCSEVLHEGGTDMRKYLKKIRKELGIFTFLTFLGYLFYSLIPYYTKILFEGEYKKAIIGYTVCLSAFVLIAYFCNITQTKYKLKFDKVLKEDYFNKVISLNYEDFSKKKVGEYISFQANDITEIGNDYLAPLMGIVTQTLRVVTYFVIITIALDLKVGLLLIGVSFLGVLFPKSLGAETAKRRNNYLDYQKKYYSKIEEIFNGFKVINSRTRNNIRENHNENLKKVLDERYKYGKANGLMWALNGLGSESLNYITFLYLGYLTFKGNISAGFAIATFQYAQSLMEPVHEILYYMNMTNSSKELVNSFLTFVEGDKAEEKKTPINSFKEITINNLNKSYENFSLQSINLNLEQNKKYALIGLNGSGKSTLFNILSSYIKDYSGEFKVDGKAIKEIETSYLIGTMNQEEYIFSQSFHDNTTVFDSYESVDNNPFIGDAERLKESNNCRVLSGGEKKLIALTRLINKNTPIILLDEPFSAVDESKKEDLLNKILSLDKTVIMITHDIGENLESFDEILFMEGGRLIYTLPYEELKGKKEFKVLQNAVNI